MCLIIVTTPQTKFSKADLSDYARSNSDGFGAMWHENGKIQIVRTLDMGDVPAITRSLEGKEAALHWRMATHGNVSEANTHPFVVNDSLAMMHNGVLSCQPKLGDPRSDTAIFAQDIMPKFLAPAKRSHVLPEDIKPLDKWIGLSNRLVFLDGHGKITIVGEGKGIRHKGAWYSNEYAWSAPRSRMWRDVQPHKGQRKVTRADAWLDGESMTECILIDDVSPRDERAVDAFKRDVIGGSYRNMTYADTAELVDWYCAKADAPATLAVLLWNVVREG